MRGTSPLLWRRPYERSHHLAWQASRSRQQRHKELPGALLSSDQRSLAPPKFSKAVGSGYSPGRVSEEDPFGSSPPERPRSPPATLFASSVILSSLGSHSVGTSGSQRPPARI